MNSFGSAWRNIRRSPYQAIAAIFIMVLTFLCVSFFAFVVFSSSRVINYFESKPQVTAFFKDESKQSEIDSLKSQLMATGKVADVKFVSKQEALKIYKEQNKNDPLLLDLVTADILPSSLEISTHEINDLVGVSDALKTSNIVQEVVFQKDVVATLSSWTNALRRVGLIFIVALSIVSVFIMMTIVGIKISQKREDIEIMRLVGASSWYVRWPFILEGVFYGVVGAFIGWAISVVVLLWATPFLSSFLRGIPIFPIPLSYFASLLGIELIIASLLGILSSSLAVFRYLR
jgi:cell division transport system permease protein